MLIAPVRPALFPVSFKINELQQAPSVRDRILTPFNCPECKKNF
jgi:hypothetical protein